MKKTTAADHDTPLAKRIRAQAQSLGFNQLGFCDIHLQQAEKDLQNWLARNYHGSMTYMQRHGKKRTRPDLLVPGTLTIISLGFDYLPLEQQQLIEHLQQPAQAYISCYALGKDYHKILRKKLKQLAECIASEIDNLHYRVFVDSAPVMEKPLAVKAGLGWQGKHTNLINRDKGSWFFLGEIYTDLPLHQLTRSISEPLPDHCGNCSRCSDVCPTQAIIAPYRLDARKCISYLTIEHKGLIEPKYHAAIGNRIYGCDDCQLVCPWNRFAQLTKDVRFLPDHEVLPPSLIQLFGLNENEFLNRYEGSPIRRIGYESWIRNLSISMGNLQADKNDLRLYIEILKNKYYNLKPEYSIARQHLCWAIERLEITLNKR